MTHRLLVRNATDEYICTVLAPIECQFFPENLIIVDYEKDMQNISQFSELKLQISKSDGNIDGVIAMHKFVKYLVDRNKAAVVKGLGFVCYIMPIPLDNKDAIQCKLDIIDDSLLQHGKKDDLEFSAVDSKKRKLDDTESMIIINDKSSSSNITSANSSSSSSGEVSTTPAVKVPKTFKVVFDKPAPALEVTCLPPTSGSNATAMNITTLPNPMIQKSLPPSSESIWTRTDIQVNAHLAEIYRTGLTTDSTGKVHKFKDITNPLEGRQLYNLVKDNKLTRTMEIGFAMGASASWICQAHKEVGLNGQHFALDPNQTAQYCNLGRKLVTDCGLKDHLVVMELPSYRAMPLLLEDLHAQKIGCFHLVYIDGWHTFDYTLVDFFYADLLLAINGIIVIDDIKHPSVASCLRYLVTNYPHYELVQQTPSYDAKNSKISTQATFIKRAQDSRVWNYHVPFNG